VEQAGVMSVEYGIVQISTAIGETADPNRQAGA